MSLGFINHVSTQPIATGFCLNSIREFYPNSPVVFSVDGYENYQNYKLPQIYDNIEWLYNTAKLGYPPYTKEQVLEWLLRTYICVLKLHTDYFMMVEDDLLILNHIEIDPSWECVGHVITHGNIIPSSFLPDGYQTNYYGNGGGSIFKTETFLENYEKITDHFYAYWWKYERDFYPQCGYMDCFMTIYFMLCGKQYTPNTRMLNLDPHTVEGRQETFDMSPSILANKYKLKYDVIHNTKFYYS